MGCPWFITLVPEEKLASNINVLTDDAGPLDPGMGATNLKGLICQIEKPTS